MKNQQDDLYYKGYIRGYRDGIRDAATGKTADTTENDITALPIRSMALSTRAINCLSQAGCVYISDVAALSDSAITVIRNMGPVTASEIARWLDAHEISYTAWNQYL